MPPDEALNLLRLMQLADSALPIGSAAHSFGLETLVAEGLLGAENLAGFLSHWLMETGLVEAVFCRAAYAGEISSLNELLEARKPSREARQASLALGRRFLQLIPFDTPMDVHFAIAFGHVGGLLKFDCDATVLAWLQQSITALISACQRLMALGQSKASRILWELKPMMIEAADKSAGLDVEGVGSFAPLLEIASMRHTTLQTRLFIS